MDTEVESTGRTSLWRIAVPNRGSLAIMLFVCVLAPAVLLTLQMDANPKFSPIDEAAHYDYVNRVAAGSVPRMGQRLLPGTRRELVCRGTDLDVKVPRCDARRLAPDDFPGGASQYEAQQPPTYYAITIPVRWVAQHVFQVDDRLDATRATGIVWLVVGLLMLWAAGSLMGIGAVPLGGALLLLVTAPVVVYYSAVVTNDAAVVAATGTVALAAALAHTGRLRRAPLWLFAAGAFAAAVKTTNLFAVGAVGVLFLVGAIVQRANDEGWILTLRRWMHDGGALMLGGGVATLLWIAVNRSISLIDPRDEIAFGVLRGQPITPGIIINQAASLFHPLTGSYVSPETLSQDVQAPLTTILGFLLIAAGFAGLFVTPRRWPQVLGLISLPTLYVGGVVFGLGLAVNYEIRPGLSGRYGLAVAPLLLLVLAASLTEKWTARAVAIFAAVTFATTFAVMLW